MAKRLCIVAALWVVLIGVVAAEADVLAPGSIRALPGRAGAPSKLTVSAAFDQPPGAQLQAYNVDIARGFVFSPRAAAGRCSVRQARSATCPSNSRIGGGTGELSVEGQSLARAQLRIEIAFYVTRPQRRGDIVGLVLAAREPKSGVSFALLGRLVRVARGPYGLELRFAHTASELPPGFRVQLHHVRVEFGTQRTVRRRRGQKTRRVTYHLLTNPRSCHRHGWPLLLTVSYSTGIEHYTGVAACTATN
jgi:hypothetical protein